MVDLEGGILPGVHHIAGIQPEFVAPEDVLALVLGPLDQRLLPFAVSHLEQDQDLAGGGGDRGQEQEPDPEEQVARAGFSVLSVGERLLLS